MKLATETKEVTRSKEFETVQYGMDQSNMVIWFQALRTNLYSNTHGSIIRELVSNVIDSHTEAGKPDAMGEVEWIPSSKLLGVDCQLIVRDFGVGLSPERMRTIFGNYFSSTKRDSNSQIGGFGLGSKSPFAYTDSFSVQTVYDGTKYRYLCYIDETMLGAISLLTDEETEEENCTEIIIPIKNEQKDFQLFQTAVSAQLGYFSTIRYKGFKQPNDTIRFQDSYCILKEEPPIEDLHIVLGNVAYTIDHKALGFTDQEWGQGGYENCGLGLKFEIGELQPTMSRESLFWNEKTKTKVMARLAKARHAIRERIEAELGAETDYGRWYGYASEDESKSFPNQWLFASIKDDTKFTLSSKKKLTIRPKFTDWFAGHNVRVVRPSTRIKAGGQEAAYESQTPTGEDLQTMPYYQLTRNLNAATCLWLFRTYPDGFIVVSELAPPDPTEASLMPYYEATKAWKVTLDDFDAIEVPEDAAETYTDERYLQYRELLKQRKLEGKFTAKILRANYNYDPNLEDCFLYNMYENKFENMKDHTVIYGFIDDHKALAAVAGILSFSSEHWDRFDSRHGEHSRPITLLKIGQQYEKQFFALPHSYYVGDVLKMETPINEIFGSIATAISIRPYILNYFTLSAFGNINAEMTTKYKALQKFVEDYTQVRSFSKGQNQAKEKVMRLCTVIRNQEFENDWITIQEYFNGVDMLKSVNFAIDSLEHWDTRNNKVDGFFSRYIKNWVAQSEPWIIEYLLAKGKTVDGHIPTMQLAEATMAPSAESLRVSEAYNTLYLPEIPQELIVNELVEQN